jgi:zinc protease
MDRRSPPLPADRRGFKFPPFEHHVLANGFSLYSCHLPEYPLVCMEALALAGAEHDPPGLRGLASLHAELIDDGTARRDALSIAREVELLGGGLVTAASWSAASAEVVALADELPRALDILADCWLAPTYPPAELERVRSEIATDLLHRRSLPAQLADDRFSRAVYGDSVYGLPVAGTPEGVAAVTREDLVAFHGRHVRPRASALLVAGAFSAPDLLARVDDLFGRQQGEPRWPSPTIVPRELPGLEIHLTDRPSSRQAQLQVGHAMVSRRHEDFPALLLLNLVLGGKFTSRINLNLRERHGYTYGANSMLVQRRGPAPFLVRTAVSSENAGAAVREILFEIGRISSEKIEEKELRDAQDYLIGVFPSTVQTSHDILGRLEMIFLYELPDHHYQIYPERLGEYTAEELLAVARRHFRPDKLVVSVVGAAEVLLPQLEKLGPVTVHSA